MCFGGWGMRWTAGQGVCGGGLGAWGGWWRVWKEADEHAVLAEVPAASDSKHYIHCPHQRCCCMGVNVSSP